MKTISIRLENDIYEEISKIIENMGQTKQTFYETYTRTVIREGEIPFIISTNKKTNDKAYNFSYKNVNRVAEAPVYQAKEVPVLDLYQLCMQMDPGLLMKQVSETKSEEENRFYNDLYNMILQKRQKEAIKNDLF